MPGLDELIDTTFGPFPVPVTEERVEAFSNAIRADPDRGGHAHPMYANTALFVAAPAFLEDPRVAPYTRSLIHSEQSYEWARPLPIGETLQVSGTVESVRARGALHFVVFSLEAETAAGPWLSGSSTFLMSDERAARSDDAGEPDEDERPPVDPPDGPFELPGEGEALAELRCGASRADLRRYAAASGDHNPIHLDHDAARAAGLEGVVVHGLLMAGWMARLADRYGSLRSMRLRFRNPLRPAVPAVVGGTVASVEKETAGLDLSLTAAGERLVTGRFVVTR